ncbi:fluoride efflux transporter CrcB [Novosphingobium sp. 9U]|uniref:fluoride efflux transporter CrcB n=1 Tax=Novosphingobium sp. 9U TaxID=2653158 RepID=UPI00135B3E2E|nr:fluoride efflux transporter CrcB [Novosphingobium sp. 9U]
MPQPPQPSFLTASLLVAAGGAIGSWLRFCVGRVWVSAIGPVRASAFPWSTLTVNVTGSLAMGLLVGWLARHGAGEATRLLLAVGVLGGFTTFSSFSLEVVSLIQRTQPGLALAYLAASLGAGLLGLTAGLLAVRGAA